MCLILFAYRVHPRYELVLAANRDEYYSRPTAPLGFWDEAPDLLAGQDLVAGGTWLGVTRDGRFAAITNYRNHTPVCPDAPSRGPLVSTYLKGREPAWDYLQRLLPRAADYNGFNLLLGDSSALFYYSNRGGDPQLLEPGVYGLSNHLLNTPWPKVERGRQGLATVLDRNAEPDTAALLSLLQNRQQAPDEALPDTGIGLELERAYSPLFIESADYGTRSSTILQVSRQGQVTILEKTWDDGSLREFCLQWPA
jgi:uncharacterized protein with NRDE domain